MRYLFLHGLGQTPSGWEKRDFTGRLGAFYERSRKLGVLSGIARRLNAEGLTWAIGGSLLLYLKKKTDTFHDIDIMAAEEDADRLREILSSMGELQPPNPDAHYKTKRFMEFVIDGVDIDVVAGFVIAGEERDYYFPLKKEEIAGYAEVYSQRIPLQSLEQWERYYELMGRPEKVNMIRGNRK